MRMTARWFAALLCAGLSASFAHAQYQPPVPPTCVPAPDACGPGFYIYCPDGSYIGPNYCLRPPWEPFNGFRPTKGGGPPMAGLPGQYGVAGGPKLPPLGGPGQKPMVVFPTHHYARSPRDFFMWTEAQEELHTRERPPGFLP
jgi:hypothetical protein